MICFLLILVLSAGIKILYMKEPLSSGPHSMKYRTLLGPPFEMSTHDDPLQGRVRYPVALENIQNPAKNNFRIIPIYSWGLYSTFEAFPKNGIDLNTHIFTNAIGLITLTLIFIYFSKSFGLPYSIIVTSIISVSILFNITYFITVWDSMMILFMFASLIFLQKFFESRKASHLFIAGMMGGIGINQKYSLFLIITPITLILLYYKSKNKIEFVSQCGFMLPLFLVPEIIHIFSLQKLPRIPIEATILFLIFSGITYIIYSKSDLILKKLEMISKRLLNNPISFVPIIILIGISSHLFLELTGLYRFSSNFLTDKYLIFNLELYKYTIIHRFIPCFTLPFFLVGLLGIFLLPVLNIPNRWKETTFAFIVGMTVYWIVASKSIFFHIYYRLIFLTVFAMSTAGIIHTINKKIGIKTGKIIFAGIVIFGLIFPLNLSAINSEFTRGPEMEKPAEYLSQNTKPDERFIALDMNSTLLTFYSNRTSINPSIHDQTIRKSIKERGFARVMESYNIKYAVTSSDMDYTVFLSAFTDSTENKNGIDRSHLIRKILGQIDNPKEKGKVDKRKELVENYGIEKYFSLEKKLDSFKFYRITSENSSSKTHISQEK